MALTKINITKPYPNQTTSFKAGSLNIQMNLYWRGYLNYNEQYTSNETMQNLIDTYAPGAYYAELYFGQNLIEAGIRVCSNQLINQYNNGIPGYIAAINNNTEEDPNLDNVGQDVIFYYADNLADFKQVTNVTIYSGR
jgi:hypothetical protein